MRIVSNTGRDRVVDLIHPWLKPGCRIDLTSSTLSLHAFGSLRELLNSAEKARLILPPIGSKLDFDGSDSDRAARNQLRGRWLAQSCADWIERTAEVRSADQEVPQGALILRGADGQAQQVVLGSFSFSTDGLGLAPANPLNLVQASETTEETVRLSQWFDHQWSSLAGDPDTKPSLVRLLRSYAEDRDPVRFTH